MVDSCEENYEDDEVQGHLQEGRWAKEGHYGSQEELARRLCKGQENSSPFSPLKK